jgi:hypothetical protein
MMRFSPRYQCRLAAPLRPVFEVRDHPLIAGRMAWRGHIWIRAVAVAIRGTNRRFPCANSAARVRSGFGKSVTFAGF